MAAIQIFPYLNSRGNLALPLSRCLFAHFPHFFLTVIINLIVWGQSVTSHVQNVFQKMSSDWVCETLNQTKKELLLHQVLHSDRNPNRKLNYHSIYPIGYTYVIFILNIYNCITCMQWKRKKQKSMHKMFNEQNNLHQNIKLFSSLPKETNQIHHRLS